MLSEGMQAALNRQLNAEMYSGYLYLSMSAYFEFINMPGFASWMRVQRLEELTHALKFFDYVAENGRVVLQAIDAPPTEWNGPLDVFEATLGHERKVSGMIADLVALAGEEGDAGTGEFLQWFVDEQVEEEETAGKIVEKIRQARDSDEELEKLDGELAQRT